MYIAGTCPEWFWLIPLVGIVFMVGMMFFMCRNGISNGMAGMCGCGHTKDRCEHEHMEGRKSPSSETPRT